jgi:hypothetical protein
VQVVSVGASGLINFDQSKLSERLRSERLRDQAYSDGDSFGARRSFASVRHFPLIPLIAIGLLSRITRWIGWRFGVGSMPILTNSKHEAFAQGLARGSSAAAAYVEAGYKENRHNPATLARKQHI